MRAEGDPGAWGEHGGKAGRPGGTMRGMRLRDLFRRKRQQPGRRGYDREQATREQVGGMKRAQQRYKDRAGNDQSGFGAF
jgi:hypothetical protein